MTKGNLIKRLVPRRLRRFLLDVLGITALHKRVDQLEERLLESKEDSWKESRSGWRETEPTTGSRLRRDITCDSFISKVSSYNGFSPEKTLELARGYFERLEYHNDKLTISGWMLLPKRDLQSFAVYINQRKVGEASTVEREDVAKECHFISHAKNSGFSFSLHRPPEQMEGTIDICVVGVSNGREIAKIETWYRTDLYSCLPIPPTDLIFRIAAHKFPSFYLITGMQAYREFYTSLCKYADPHSIKSMLDWGCGCGRIIGFFLKFSGIPRICGCDIDAEAIHCMVSG